jgi:phosphatidylglycerol lysyltransferase
VSRVLVSRAGRARRWAAPLAVLALFGVALWLLHRELHDYHYHQIVREVWSLPRERLLLALLFTALAYAVLPGYDAVALRYIDHPLPLTHVGFGSFVAYGLSQTLGFPLVTGGSVRYRFWSAWGLSTTEIAQAAGFAGATFTLGVIAMAGVVFLLEPATTVRLLPLPVAVLRGAGVLCLGIVATYLAWSATRSEPLRLGGWTFPVPPPRIALAQLLVAAVDWAAAGAVLYVLLPPTGDAPLRFVPFLGIFLLAQYAGLASHVPGGVGVFETLVVLLLRPFLPTGSILAALVVYRVVYYLLPFALALLLLAAHETVRQRRHVAAAGRTAAATAARWVPAILPHALSVTTFIGGAILLFSGATPSLRYRVAALDRVLPLGVIEVSHFAASVVGAGLVVLAWGIRARLDAAFGATVALLCVGIVASLLKGLDWEEATVLAVVLVALLPSRRVFYRRTALTSEPFSPGWTVAVLLVVLATLWLGLFSFKRVDYSAALWLEFRTHADAPRFLRATAGVVGGLGVFGLMRLMRHAEAEPEPPGPAELERAAGIVARSPETYANLALLGDKTLLFSEGGGAFIMYGVERRSWVALGDPVGPRDECRELAWRFREEADRHGGWPVFYLVNPEMLPLYLDLGLTLYKLGEQARVDLATFTLDGGDRKSMRRTLKDADRAGVVFEVVPREGVPALLPELRRVSDEWLAEKSTREKGFSLGRFDDEYLRRFPVAVVRSGAGGEISAFANVWLGADREELSVDLMRHSSSAPRGAMDLLFLHLMLWGKSEGYRWFDLGMAPLSGFERRAHAPRWHRVGALVFRHGEHFYNFQGLRQYKEKFDPVWEPRYLASPGGLAMPRILANVAALISGGLRGVVAK